MINEGGPPLLNSLPCYTVQPGHEKQFKTNRGCAYKVIPSKPCHVLAASVPFDLNWGRSLQYAHTAPIDPGKAAYVNPFAIHRGSTFRPVSYDPPFISPYQYKQGHF